MADRLTDDTTRHWTGAPHPLTSLLRVDGKAYRIMGKEPAGVAPLPQTGAEVLPTRTIYSFEGAGIRLELTFLSPLLPYDLDVLSRPVTYITWTVHSIDSKRHRCALYFEAGTELAVNTTDQEVGFQTPDVPGLITVRTGTKQQPVLAKSGDDLRIDWGYLYAAAPNQKGTKAEPVDRARARASFLETGDLPSPEENFRRAEAIYPVLAFRIDMGRVAATPVARHLLLAYDDLFSIELFGKRLRPYWRRKGAEAADLLTLAERDYAGLSERAKAFDTELMEDLRRAGGEEYARLAALAYRQTIAANKLVAAQDGTPLFFPKENFSNGCISTVDVHYPEAPLFLLMSPELLKASLKPVLDYALSDRWRFPFAPHDLGIYPKANGQVYGGGETSAEKQMPVEESGNMLLLALAIAQAEGNPGFAQKYWPLLSRWAGYLKEKGLDPENQLSTDDFMGHLAHNANLSLKAILALGAYGRLCRMTGREDEGEIYQTTARRFAREWLNLADAGDHYRLAFDVPGSWSQKYNLVWDDLLGLGLFPAEVARKEMAFYRTKQDRYGVPLDSRKRLTKLDWLLWTATLAKSQDEFEAFVHPAYLFAHETPMRVPLADGHWTEDAKQRNKAQARSVVGGVFLKLLYDEGVWKKWASRSGQ
jgi:hypothetical protein